MDAEKGLDKATCDDWAKIPVHCAQCGVQFLRAVRYQKYCAEHRHLAGAVIRPQEASSSNRKLSPERQRMRRIVENFQRYVATYDKQAHFESYSDTIFMDDMLYGIGIAIDKGHYEFASGFDKFKEVIRQRLPSETPAGPLACEGCGTIGDGMRRCCPDQKMVDAQTVLRRVWDLAYPWPPGASLKAGEPQS